MVRLSAGAGCCSVCCRVLVLERWLSLAEDLEAPMTELVVLEVYRRAAAKGEVT